MSSTRWYNAHLPQTLVIAQFLLYFDAFFALLNLFSVATNSRVSFTFFGGLIAFASVAGYIYGAWGIANEHKRGYQVAVVASFLPLASRVVNTLGAGGPVRHLHYVLLGFGIINALFEYALIGLLLHTQSREHQRIWFR